MVIDCGMVETNWDGSSSAYKRQVYVRFELPEVIIPSGEYEGKTAGIGQRYTFSMHKKSNLRRDLQTWRGKPFSDAEAEAFDLVSIAGRSATLQIFTNDKGYNSIQIITPYSGDLKATEPVLVFDTEDYTDVQYKALPDWVQKKINLPSSENEALRDEYADVTAQQYEKEQRDTANGTDSATDDFSDSLPF